MNLRIEKYYWKKGFGTIVGLDEAGRGPLAGPVTAAAVIINSKIKNQKSKLKFKNQNFRIFKEILENTKDSKRLSEKQREKIFNLTKQSSYIKSVHSSVGPKTIDKINIEKSTKKAMRNCLNKILSKCNFKKILILIDGNRIIDKTMKVKQMAVVKGDDKIFSIALASIVAKVIRDRKMEKLSFEYPQYQFSQHKGYGTELHRYLLKKYGPCKIHRKSFRPILTLKL